MKSYSTKPFIDAIIRKLEKLEIKPVNPNTIREIEKLLRDETLELQRISGLLDDYAYLTEIQDKMLKKQKEVDCIYKSLLDDDISDDNSDSV